MKAEYVKKIGEISIELLNLTEEIEAEIQNINSQSGGDSGNDIYLKRVKQELDKSLEPLTELNEMNDNLEGKSDAEIKEYFS